MTARVLRSFRGNPTGYGDAREYEVGETFSLPHPLVPPRVHDSWVREGYIEIVTTKAEPEAPQNKMRASPTNKQIEHVGGGWYELPNGERVRGKNAALEALEEE